MGAEHLMCNCGCPCCHSGIKGLHHTTTCAHVDNSGKLTIKMVMDGIAALQQADEAGKYSGLYNSYLRWCGRCHEVLRRDQWHKTNSRDWLHNHKGGVWCKNDKQHGPKTRRAFPLPSLLVIEEMEL
jgi:hypothetical protein